MFLTEGYSPGQEPQTGLDCVHSIAQGEVQCCVTGQAFEHLLQHAEAALLECVVRHAVVFARMQSQQKGRWWSCSVIEGCIKWCKGGSIISL